MNFPDGLFGQAWIYGAYVPLLLIWAWSLCTAHWRRMLDSAQIHVWLGAIVVLMLAWRMKAEVGPGLTMHFIGATAFTLMFGRQLAIVGLSVVLAATTLNSMYNMPIGWQSFGLNAMAMIAFPVFLAGAILQAAEKWLPSYFFIYIFVAAFFGSAVNVLLTGLASTLLLGAASVYPLGVLFTEFYPSYVLLAFAEAWLTGALITVMLIYLPDWVGTFEDQRYLSQK